MMKILQVCPKPPFPSTDGGCLAMAAVARGLLEAGHELHIFTLSTAKHPFKPQHISAELLRKTHIVHHDIDTAISKSSAAISWLTGGSYISDRFRDNEAERKLIALITENDFDIIHFESIYTAHLAQAVRSYSKAPFVLRTHNIECDIWKRMAEKENRVNRFFLNSMSSRLQKFEKQQWKWFDGVVAITPEDEKAIAASGASRLVSIPHAIQIPPQPEIDPEPNTVFHLGAMDWHPNQQGVDWLLNEVWPRVVEKNPLARLHLAGRAMPNRYYSVNEKGVFVEGEVVSANDFISHKEVMVVPVFAGSGIRVKILEGLAHGKPIISTSMGMAGINCTPGEHLLIADSAQEFAEAISFCLLNKSEAKKLGEAGKSLIKEKYHRPAITKKLTDFYQTLLRK